jgi:hypothetical protein
MISGGEVRQLGIQTPIFMAVNPVHSRRCGLSVEPVFG